MANILAADMGTVREEQRATLNTEALRTRGSAVLFSRGNKSNLHYLIDVLLRVRKSRVTSRRR
jgi:hypothetical protein